ncbi:MAG: hypothetical protein OXC27_16065 [Caldilineaceae bacterium]|nr:hypothetical protein [Caldilineaceae bacterium]
MDELFVLDGLKARPSDMFRGALLVIGDGSNPDRIAQAAHSLREIIFPFLSNRVRTSQRHRSAITDVGLGRMYGDLSHIAHHGAIASKRLKYPNLTRADFDRLRQDFEQLMRRALIRPTDLDRQIELHRQIDEFLSGVLPK